MSIVLVETLTDQELVVAERVGKDVFMERHSIKSHSEQVYVLYSFLSVGSSDFENGMLSFVENASDDGDLAEKIGP